MLLLACTGEFSLLLFYSYVNGGCFAEIQPLDF